MIDLTIASDTSGLFTSGSTAGHVKREQGKEGDRVEETEGEGVGGKEKRVRKIKESKMATRVQRSEGSKEGLKKYKRRKSSSVIPLALKKTKKSAIRNVDYTSQEEEASGVSEQEATLTSKKKNVVEESTKGLASKVARKAKQSGRRDSKGESGSDTTTQKMDEKAKSSYQESLAGGRKRQKKGDAAGNKMLGSVGGSDSVTARRSAVEKDGELTTDCLVETTQDDVGNVRKVKVQHRKAKRGVSISDQVVVMGEGGRGGGEKSPKEWTKTEVQKLSR